MSIIENVKEIANLVRKLDDIDLYRRILALKQEAFELNEENRLPKERINNLKNIEDITSKMIFKSPFWYMEGDAVPYCPRCWENDTKTIHLMEIPFHGYECPQCNNRFVMKDGIIRNIRLKQRE